MAQRRPVTAEMLEANYLVGNTDGPGPYYRLLMRCFYERYRSHVSYFFDRREQFRSLLHSLAPQDELLDRRPTGALPCTRGT